MSEHPQAEPLIDNQYLQYLKEQAIGDAPISAAFANRIGEVLLLLREQYEALRHAPPFTEEPLTNYDLAFNSKGQETFALLAIADALTAQTAMLKTMGDEIIAAINNLRETSLRMGLVVKEGGSLYDPDLVDFAEWVAGQSWPDHATHATLDAKGGCCWWIGEPAVDSQAAIEGELLGWSGALAERYYDVTHPFAPKPGQAWYETLIRRLDATRSSSGIGEEE